MTAVSPDRLQQKLGRHNTVAHGHYLDRGQPLLPLVEDDLVRVEPGQGRGATHPIERVVLVCVSPGIEGQSAIDSHADSVRPSPPLMALPGLSALPHAGGVPILHPCRTPARFYAHLMPSHIGPTLPLNAEARSESGLEASSGAGLEPRPPGYQPDRALARETLSAVHGGPHSCCWYWGQRPNLRPRQTRAAQGQNARKPAPRAGFRV